MDLPLISWGLLAGALLVALVFSYVEYQAYLLRTEIQTVPGGLRFVAHNFTVEARRSENTMLIACKSGRYSSRPLAGGQEQTRMGSLNVSLPVAGMRIKVTQIVVQNGSDAPSVATGFSSIVFAASDELIFNAIGKPGGQRSALQLDRIPDSVARKFGTFAGGLDAWIDKLEQGLVADIAARKEQAAKDAAAQAAEQAAAQPLAAEAETAAQATEVVAAPLDPESKAKAQLAEWRLKAGFTGSMTDMRLDAVGNVDWLIDLNADGRIILHADKRHFHGSLNGAVVAILADGLEVMVRDEYWQEGDSRMPTFRVLKGESRELLLTWRKRLSEAMERFQVDPDKNRNDGFNG